MRPDRYTRGLDRLRPGQAITLVDETGAPLASALADPDAAVCARVFHRRGGMAFDPATAVRRAWERRAALHADAATNCYRVAHGEADFLPGLRIERYAGVLTVVAFATCIVPHLEAVCGALAHLAPGAAIAVKLHLDDLRRDDIQVRPWPSGTRLPDGPLPVRELGVELLTEPGAGLATGIYVDQRATRAWLRPQAAGRRVLNLFAYTGAFSASLLAAGAANALDVDLAAPALERAAENAARNRVGNRHRTLRADAGAFLSATSEHFDLIIIDPPTAAQGGGGWVLRRDYRTLLSAAWARLAPSGLLVAVCNTLHGKPFPLAETVAALGGETQGGCEPGADIPLLRGFPEGRPWRLAARRSVGG